MAYLLDANTLIEAQRRFYGFDFCPAYWDWLERSHSTGVIYSVERVADEILPSDDDLSRWARARGSDFFLKPDAQVLASLTALSAWASSGEYRPSAVSSFLDAADSYLVAHAHAYGHIVVTQEQVATTARIVKIPNACVAFSVRCINVFDLLRAEHARFVLGS